MTNVPPTRVLDAKTFLAAAGAVKEKLRQRNWKPPASKTSPRPYIELRAASAFSFLDGASLPEDLVDQAATLGLPAMALIDTNGVYGAPRFYGAAKKAGLRALVGAEIVLEESASELTSLIDGTSTMRLVADAPPHRKPVDAPRLTLLVESQTGYRNLCRLLTAGALNRPKGEARYSWDLIRQHADGLHCLTGGDEGPLAQTLNEKGVDAARDLVMQLQSIFPRRLHVELQRHRRRDQEHRNIALLNIARSLRLPYLATNSVRHARPDEKELLDVLTCIQHGKTLDKAGRLLNVNRERQIKSAAQMSEVFADLPEAIDHAYELGSRLDFTLANLGYRFPDYPLPPGETPSSYLRQISWNGARARFRPLTARAQAQIAKELDLIEKLDLAGYFLIVWDIVQFCLKKNILVQGRGSAANSAVCYALSITAIDPVKMDLLFERFLSEERGEWPDIDLDLPSGDEREEVIQYVYKRYGALGAAMTANVITYRERSSAREVAKSLGFSTEQIDRFAKQVGQWSFGEVRDRVEYQNELAAAGLDPEDARVRHLVRLWMQMQNLPRHLGQHSGGMVMAGGRLDDVVPLEPAAMPGRVVIQWDKDDCADLGIIKVDLLGLGMLAAIEEALPMIRVNEKIDVDLAHLPQQDPLVFKMLNEADTVGVFQVESRAQMASLPKNAPKVFYDIVVQVAIIRPGPIVGGMVRPFFDRRQGKRPVEYPHPCLEPILERTLGVPLFQEQLLRIAMVAAGFTGGEAEELRRAMGFKRSVERMTQIEKRLRDGMTTRGIVGDAQDQIVKSITSFALYGFPESHAASFALIAYASCYLKAHHPVAFFASLLNAWPMGFYHPATLIKDAQRHCVEVRSIDVNHSGWKCRWEEGALRLGMKFVKGLQQRQVNRIEEEQAIRPFASVDDLQWRCRLRDDQLTRLAWSGALASFGLTRRAALWQASQAAKPAGPLWEKVSSRAREHEGQNERSLLCSTGTLACVSAVEAELPVELQQKRHGSTPRHTGKSACATQEPSPLPEMSPLEETLSDYASMELTTGAHLMEHYRAELSSHNVASASDLTKMPNGHRVTTAGAVIVRQRPGTAKGFVFLTLEDETGMMQAIVRPDLFRENRSLIVSSSGLVIEGILQNDIGQPSIRAERFWPLPDFAELKSHDFH
ncbi:MAG TPA: error-prone DNA polymerase [Thermoanaerobaculia bacterium]|nr:error-prone DNA polymerase [Thermoanaerobaculia bacterium]